MAVKAGSFGWKAHQLFNLNFCPIKWMSCFDRLHISHIYVCIFSCVISFIVLLTLPSPSSAVSLKILIILIQFSARKQDYKNNQGPAA